VLDTRELGRRPGSQREVVRTVPAPADLGIEVLRVPEGAPVEVDLRIEAVMEGVLVTGTARAGLEGECARCLEPISEQSEVTFQELFVYGDQDYSSEEDNGVSMLDWRPKASAAVQPYIFSAALFQLWIRKFKSVAITASLKLD